MFAETMLDVVRPAGIEAARRNIPDNVKWLPADYKRMLRMLKNPVYTGAYVLGRTETFLDRTDEGEFVRRRRVLPPDQWKVIEKDRHPAYISWEQYERNLTKIKANSPMNGNTSPETARRGASLLSGMLRCARHRGAAYRDGDTTGTTSEHWASR